MLATFIGNKRLKFESLDSTNNYAIQLIEDQLPEEGSIVWATEQKKGKGQRGNFWESEKGKNLTFSIILYPDFLKPEEQFYLSKVISLGIVEYLKSFVRNIKIKWPNDIYAGNNKIAGILIENSLIGSSISHCVAGIGININQVSFTSDAPNPISLKLLNNKDFDLEVCLNHICLSIENLYLVLKNKNFSDLDIQYLNNLYLLEQKSLFKSKGEIFEGRITGITNVGELIIKPTKGEEKNYSFDEISYMSTIPE